MKTDMSEKAITLRLKRVSQLRRLCLSLEKATPIADEKKESGKTRKSVATKK